MKGQTGGGDGLRESMSTLPPYSKYPRCLVGIFWKTWLNGRHDTTNNVGT